MISFKSLAKKRSEDKLIDERKEYLKSETNASLVAIWEDKSNDKILKNQVKNLAKDFQTQQCMLLHVRQKRMKDLFEHEESRWREQIMVMNQVSSEERMDGIRKRAEALRSRRQKEEMEFCKRMLEQQRINGSEELRRSKPLIIDEISVPIHKKTDAECSNLQHHFGRDDIEKETIEKASMAMKLALDEQVRMNDKRRSITNEERKNEDKIQLERWNREIAEENARSSIEKQNTRTRIKNELQNAIMMIQNKKKRDIMERRQHEEQISLQNKDEEASKVPRKSCVSYIDSLKYQILSKNKVDPEVEALREAFQDKMLKEKNQEIRDREEKKKKITLEVAMENKARMHENAISKEKDKKETANFLQRELVHMKERSIVEDAEKERKKNEAIENAKYNQAEVERKTKLRVAEKQRQLVEERDASFRWQIV